MTEARAVKIAGAVRVRKPHKPWSPSTYQKISYAPFAG
jgi:hypothetical protein